MSIPFEVLVDESFSKINSDPSLSPVQNKAVLSLVNDFEDGCWRYSKFQNFIWDNVAETALSFRERESLIDKNHSTLVAAAKNLRLTDRSKEEVGQGSEIAEIFMYGVMKHYYNSLPIVPKIFYKQNSQDNAKGADSVHIVIEGDKDFSLWFGEAKFYNNIEDTRLDKIVKSVETLLMTGKLKKENAIITNLSDIDYCVSSRELRARIRKVLSSTSSIDDLKPKLHVPILLLHQCPITCKCSDLTQRYRQDIIQYHKQRSAAYFRKQLNKCGNSVHKYSEITFHLILFPVSNKAEIIQTFIANVEHYKKQ